MIEADITCVMNAFFKESNKVGIQYFDLLFNILYEPNILPLLAGYFYRTILSLMNNKHK